LLVFLPIGNSSELLFGLVPGIAPAGALSIFRTERCFLSSSKDKKSAHAPEPIRQLFFRPTNPRRTGPATIQWYLPGHFAPGF